MSRRSFAARGVSIAFLSATLLAIEAVAVREGLLAAEKGVAVANARLTDVRERWVVARAIQGAARQLAEPQCQGLFDEFADASGQPLRATLDAQGLSGPDYLARVFFYDAPASLCGSSNLVITTPGSRAVLVCGPRFVREMAKNSPHAEATIIHEMLHSLGLGENPPSSDDITSRVRARCGRGHQAVTEGNTLARR
jgi:hypothetical protein